MSNKTNEQELKHEFFKATGIICNSYNEKTLKYFYKWLEGRK